MPVFPVEAMDVSHRICHANYGFPLPLNDLLVNCGAGTLNWTSGSLNKILKLCRLTLGIVPRHIHTTAAEEPLNSLQRSYCTSSSHLCWQGWAIH